MPAVVNGVRTTPTSKAATLNWAYDVVRSSVSGVQYVNKFGFNSAVGATSEEIWDYSAPYEYLADDTFATMYISSDAAADQSLTYVIQGIDNNYNLASVEATTDGANGRVFVALTGTWWRIFRAYNSSGTAAAGNIYISKDNTDVGGDGIPDTVTDIQAQIKAGEEQTLMSLWTVPKGKTAYLVQYYASTSSAKATTVRLMRRNFGGVFRNQSTLTINQDTTYHNYPIPLTADGKSDLKIMAAAAGGGGSVAAGFTLWYE